MDVLITVPTPLLKKARVALTGLPLDSSTMPIYTEAVLANIHTRIPDKYVYKDLITNLLVAHLPFDIKLKNGSGQFARFDEDGVYHRSTQTRLLSRDWNNQLEYRQRWQTVQMLQLLDPS